jgi:plastocyanin
MSTTRLTIGRTVRLSSLIALTAIAMALPAGAAQDAAPHPAHIHAGTCETLGDVVEPLTDVASPDTGDAAAGLASALPVESSVTRVTMPLQSLLDGEHAVNVHKSADEIDVYIACGAIGGVASDDRLVIGLGELNDSGYTGVAVLEGDGEATDVTVYLVQAAGTPGTESAAQESAPVAAETEAVEIKGFAYNPPTIEVPAGGSVTWTNQDNSPHTATAVDRAALQSGLIAFGNSFTQTFDTPGTYDYFCEFHPNMKGTIVVK